MMARMVLDTTQKSFEAQGHRLEGTGWGALFDVVWPFLGASDTATVYISSQDGLVQRLT